MMTALFSFLSAAFSAWREVFAAKNAPDVKAAAIAAGEVKEKDGIERSVAKKDTDAIRKALASCLVLAMIVASAGCTITPKIPHDSQSSFDGNTQNSGFIGWADSGAGIITPKARERYNALVVEYGWKFTPALVKDSGVTALTDGNWLIDAEHLVNFGVMQKWKKSVKK